MTESFGAELRRLRLAAGYSLAGLAQLVYYSKSHLSKVENGLKPPSDDLARTCDGLLGADGALLRLAPGDQRRPAQDGPVGRAPGAASGVWFLRLDPDGAPRAYAGDDELLGTFRMQFDQYRRLGQQLGADLLLPMVVTNAHALRRIGEDSTGSDQRYAYLLAARYAEYAGWIVQEAGDDAYATWWTEQAVGLSTLAGDEDMAAYAYVRRALMALYRGDADETIALARRAQAERCAPRIRGLAAQREAQGHALNADDRSCRAAFERARTLLTADPGDGGPVLGTSTVADPTGLAFGWSLLDLGRREEAATTLRAEISRIPRTAYRARARYGARLARALAASAQVDEACAVADEALDDYRQTASATIGGDLRALGVSLRRWPRHPGAHRIGLRLTAALRPAYVGHTSV